MATKIWNGSVSTDPTTAGNWTGGALADGDSVIFPAGATVNCIGNDFAATMQFVGFTVEEGCTITIGTAAIPFKIDLKDGSSYATANLSGTGTQYLTINNADTINVLAAGSAATGVHGLNLAGTNDSASKGNINIRCASPSMRVSLAANAGESGNFNAITVSGGTVTIGQSVTKTGPATPSLTMDGGAVYNSAPLNVVTKYAGDLYQLAGAVTTYTGTGGTTHYRSTGTLTTGTVGGSDSFIVDDLRARTFTTFTVSGPSASFKDSSKTVTFTNPLSLSAGATCSRIDLGTNLTLARA